MRFGMRGMMSNYYTRLLVLALAGFQIGFASSHYVRASATGSKSGADWTNAYTDLPVRLNRGDTYYLAAGGYGPHTFNDSGSSVITVKRATAADHGTNTGWSDSYVGQAIFTPTAPFDVYKGTLTFSTGNYTVDGNGCTTATTGCGIVIDNTWPHSYAQSIRATGAVSNFTFKYLEIKGAGMDAFYDSGGAMTQWESLIYLNGASIVFIQNCYLHDSNSAHIKTQGVTTMTVERNIVARNGGNTIHNHGESWAEDSSSNVTIRFNEFQDTQGTAVLGIGLNKGTSDAWLVYGNVFMYHRGNPYRRTGVDNGIMSAVTGGRITNSVFYNNDVINVPGYSTRIDVQSSNGSSIIVKNNIWYSCSGANHAAAKGVIATYNYYSGTNHFAEMGEQVTSIDPFVAWASGNYRLSAATNVWTPLSSPYDTDPAGITRTSSRGVYEYVAAQSVPNPPSGLHASAQ